MSYSEATFSILKQRYGIQQDYQSLFPTDLPLRQPSERLIADIADGLQMQLVSEKAKSEFLIAPIVRELQRNNPNVTFFSGVSLNIAGEKWLNGTPDFMVSAKPRRADVEAPIFCLVEAKNGVIEEGFAQCSAEMYAAQLFNEQNQDFFPNIYGVVTNAFQWVFLRLEHKTVYIDTQRYFLNELHLLYSVLQYIIIEATKNIYKP
ncbi:MAG: hypothetical protein JNM36_06755 [Chitinophagales bacterium]|nr:hypothetical protein [Chitinophagales bacterium]